ncbi:hypothetical protein J6590_050286, partial [Homalodisca vitripennis]
WIRPPSRKLHWPPLHNAKAFLELIHTIRVKVTKTETEKPYHWAVDVIAVILDRRPNNS